jgi:hypothetical protein
MSWSATIERAFRGFARLLEESARRAGKERVGIPRFEAIRSAALPSREKSKRRAEDGFAGEGP